MTLFTTLFILSFVASAYSIPIQKMYPTHNEILFMVYASNFRRKLQASNFGQSIS